MSDLKEVLNGVLGTVLNMPEAEVSSLYDEEGNWKEGSTDVLKAKNADRVQRERDKATADRKEQHQRGRKERGIELEKALKAVGVEIGEATGEEAVQKFNEFLESKVAAAAKPSDLDDNGVKSHKLYRELEKASQAALKAKEDEHSKAWTERDAKDQRERILSDVKSKAKSIFDELKPNLPEDPKKAAKLVGVLMSEFDGLSYEMDGDELLNKDKDGKRLENDHGHPIKLDDLVKSKSAEYFDFQASEKRGSIGDPTKGTKAAIKLQKPATRQAYAQQLHEINSNANLSAEERGKMAADLKELAKDLA